jgi:predicted small metal-binding protein
MSADKALRCDCGFEVRADDELARVDAVQRHAWEAHGVDLSVELALEVVHRAGPVPSGEPTRGKEKEKR